MLSHVKYQNSNLTKSKKSKYYQGTPVLETKLLLIKSVKKKIQCPILLYFRVYTRTQGAVSCKILKF